MRLLSAGINKLDRLTGGFAPGNLVLVAGRGGAGKSSLLTHIVAHTALGRRPEGVIWLSNDSCVHRVRQAILANISGEPLRAVADAAYEPRLSKKLGVAVKKLAAAPLFITDSWDTTHILSSLLGAVAGEIIPPGLGQLGKDKTRMLVVDHLRCVRNQERSFRSDTAHMIAILAHLKKLAVERQMVVLAAYPLLCRKHKRGYRLFFRETVPFSFG